MALIVTAQPTDNLQDFLDLLETAGGGILNLNPIDVFYPNNDILIPSNVTINGNGAIIDFGGNAYQVRVEGSNPYSDGTISATFGSTTITGSGTTWDDSMVGQSILIGDYWYPIASIETTTSLTLETPFVGTDLSGDTYVIATTVDGVQIQNLTLYNSSTTLLKYRYCNGITFDSVILDSGNQGVDADDSAYTNLRNSSVSNCVSGVTFNNVPFSVINNTNWYNITGGTALYLNRVSNTAIDILSLQAITGVGVQFTDCYDLGFINSAIIQCTSHAVEFVSGNNSMNFSDGYISTCGGDGIKFTASTDGIQIYGNNILNTTGYQVNVANSSCTNNILSINVFDGSGTGAVNDSGTTTLIRSNIGTADN